MAIGFLDINQQTLKHFGFFVGIENLERGFGENASIDHFYSAVDPHRRIVPRNEKDQPDLWIAFDISVTMKKLIACDIRDQQLLVIENLHKSRRAAFGRRVAIAAAVACRHHTKRRMADKILDPGGHERSNLAFGSFRWKTEFILVFATHQRLLLSQRFRLISDSTRVVPQVVVCFWFAIRGSDHRSSRYFSRNVSRSAMGVSGKI